MSYSQPRSARTVVAVKSPIPTRPRRLKSHGGSLSAVSVLSIAVAVISLLVAVHPSSSTAPQATQPVRIVTEDDTVEIPTPSRPIARGERLSDVPMATIRWPKSRISSDYVIDLQPFRDAVVRTALPQFLPVPRSALTTTPIESNHVAEAIPQGMRAITVRVDAESAVEGWAQSGSFVDVILVRRGGGSEGELLETKVIAENVRILSAGRSAEPTPAEQSAPKPPSTVTLLTSQDDALRIKAAANLGKLTFALRGHGDQSPTISLSLDERSLLGPSKTLVSVGQDFSGVARGPDGRTYVLDRGSKWIMAAEEITANRLGGVRRARTPPESAETAADETSGVSGRDRPGGGDE